MAERKFRVIPSSMTGKGKKIHWHGEEVTESQLEGSAARLIKDGFIEEIESGKKAKGDEGGEPEDKFANGLPEYDDVTAGQIKEQLTKLEIEFDAKAKHLHVGR